MKANKYLLRELGRFLYKLEVTHNPMEFWHLSMYYKLRTNLEKINVLVELKDYEQKIKDTKTEQRP